MAKTHFKGTEIHTNGDLPSVGSVAPDFILIKNDLSNFKLSDLKGKRVVLNIFPSVDTGVCAASVRRFNKDAANLNNSVILCISKDLPFAQGRFCGAEGIDNVIMLSDFQNNDFVNAYGILLTDGPLKGLHARSVVVIVENGKVTYNQLVNDIVEEPDYEAALKALK